MSQELHNYLEHLNIDSATIGSIEDLTQEIEISGAEYEINIDFDEMDGNEYLEFQAFIEGQPAGKYLFRIDLNKREYEYLDDGNIDTDIERVLEGRIRLFLNPPIEKKVTKDNVEITDLNFRELEPDKPLFDIKSLDGILEQSFRLGKGRMEMVSESEVLYLLYLIQRGESARILEKYKRKNSQNVFKVKINDKKGVSIFFKEKEGVFYCDGLLLHDDYD